MEDPPTKNHPYLPAMGKDALLPLYDPILRLIGKARIDRVVVEQAGIAPGDRVLELGCGTGSVSLLVKRTVPGAAVTGLDPDPRSLARAAHKAQRAGLTVTWDQGFAQELPYPRASFDRVLSVLVLHHIDPCHRAGALREARRVLAPEGSLHLIDIDDHAPDRRGLLSRMARHGHGPSSSSAETLPAQLRTAGFSTVTMVEERRHPVIGRLAFYRAC